MTREEAIKTIRRCCPKVGDSQCDFESALRELVPELAESEDERIRKEIIDIVEAYRANCVYEGTHRFDDCLAYLEKQKENIEKEYVFRPLAGTDITIAAEQAIRRADEGGRLVLAFNGAYIPVRKGCNANKIVDIYDAFIKKQKGASYAIEAVERIDKYIDVHLANAHDMKDSNPEKKYYRGWDDALGKMSGILQDVYSGEKQKEQKHTLKFKVGDKVHLEGDEINILTITGIEKDRYLTDNSYGPILFGAEDIWQIVEQKSAENLKWTDLTWKDIVELEGIINNVHYDFSAGIGQESFGKEVLERFRSKKDDAEVDACEREQMEVDLEKEIE